MLTLKSVSCVLFEPHYVCAIKCRKVGNAIHVASYAIEYTTPQDTPQQLHTKIQSILKRTRISPKNLWVIPALDQVLIKEITFPPMNPKLVTQALFYDIDQHVPHSAEHIAYGYSILTWPKQDKTHLLLGIIKKDTLRQEIQRLKTLKIQNPHISIKAPALASFYTHNNDTRFNTEAVLLLDVSAPDVMNILILAQGMLRFAKTISFDHTLQTMLATSTEHNTNIPFEWEKTFENIESSITYFQTLQAGIRPAALKIHSIKPWSDTAIDMLCRKLNMSNIPAENSREAVEKEYIAPYGLAISLLHNKPYIELREATLPLSAPERYGKMLCTILFLVILLLTAYLCRPLAVARQLHHINRTTDTYQDKLQTSKKLQNQIKTLTQSIQEEYKNAVIRTAHAAMLQELQTLLPAKTHIAHIHSQSDGQVTLKGLTLSLANVKQALALSAHFKSVTISEWQESPTPYPQHIGFEAHFYYSNKEGESREQA